MWLLRTQGERHPAKGRKALQLPGNGGVGAKTKEPGSLKRVSSREPVCPRLRGAMVSAAGWCLNGAGKRRQANHAKRLGRSRLAFVPVTIAPEKAGGQIANDAPAIEIELGDIRIRVKGRVDGAALRTVLSALQAARC